MRALSASRHDRHSADTLKVPMPEAGYKVIAILTVIIPVVHSIWINYTRPDRIRTENLNWIPKLLPTSSIGPRASSELRAFVLHCYLITPFYHHPTLDDFIWCKELVNRLAVVCIGIKMGDRE